MNDNKINDVVNDVKQKVADTADAIVKKTSTAIEVSKIRSEIRTLKKSNDRDFIDIGKMIFEKFQLGEIPNEALIPFCTDIEGREATISEYQLEIERIKAE